MISAASLPESRTAHPLRKIFEYAPTSSARVANNNAAANKHHVGEANTLAHRRTRTHTEPGRARRFDDQPNGGSQRQRRGKFTV